MLVYLFVGLATGVVLYKVFRRRPEPLLDPILDFVSEVRPLNPQRVSRGTQTDPESPMRLITDEPRFYFEQETCEWKARSTSHSPERSPSRTRKEQ